MFTRSDDIAIKANYTGNNVKSMRISVEERLVIYNNIISVSVISFNMPEG